MAASLSPPRKVVRRPRFETIRKPDSLVQMERFEADFGLGTGERAKGFMLSPSSFKLKVSNSSKTDARVPPEGLALCLVRSALSRRS